jgi:hypothetical protein
VDGVCDACGGEVVQRADDADEVAVARRLDIYFEQTTPVIDYYRGKKLLKEVDGGLSIDVVQQAMQAAIKPKPVRKAKPVAKPVKKVAKKVTKKAPVKKAKPVKKAATKKATRK